MFAATIRQLVKGDYLVTGGLEASIVDEGRTSRFPAEVAVTEKAHTVLDGWPGAPPDELVQNLLAVLAAAAAAEPDPQRKGRLEALAAAVRDVGVSVTSEVLAKVLTGGI